MAEANAAPRAMASAPPSQTSFCTSTMINARTRSTISSSGQTDGRELRRRADCLLVGPPGNPAAMLIRRIARPLLSAVFIGQGIDSLLHPKPAAEAAAPAVEGLRSLADPVGMRIRSHLQTLPDI